MGRKLPFLPRPHWLTSGTSQGKLHRGAIRGGGEGTVATGGTWHKNETVLMPGLRTLIFQAEIRGYITLGNGVGNINRTLQRLWCENSAFWFE